MIIFRYLTREVFGAFLVISFILLVIFLSNQFAHYLRLTAAGKLMGWQLVHLMILEVPQILSLVFPLSFYLSILLVYGKLYADSEIIVLSACGMSQKQLLQMTFYLSLMAAVPVMLFTVWINPVVANKRDQLLAHISATSMLQTLLPGRFQQTRDGNQIFYIESMSNDRQSLKNIFVAQRSKEEDSWTVMQAERGQYVTNLKTKDNFVVAQNGYRYEGKPGEKNFTIYHFGQYGVRLNMPVSYIRHNEIDSVPTLQLWQPPAGRGLDYAAELQWRLGLPLCVLILTFIAFSLSRVAPRAGRFAKFFPAVLIYIIYANFMIVGQDWISRGQLSPYLGLWSLHILMIILGIGLWMHQQNSFRRLKRKWRAA
jgi:lipopolysaccharide export system permease protein